MMYGDIVYSANGIVIITLLPMLMFLLIMVLCWYCRYYYYYYYYYVFLEQRLYITTIKTAITAISITTSTCTANINNGNIAILRKTAAIIEATVAFTVNTTAMIF